MSRYHCLDDAIDHFFSGSSVTRRQCDRAAAKIIGEPVEPVPVQGAFSYTVACEDLIVQFRLPDSPLDTATVRFAREIYGQIVPTCVEKGITGPPLITIFLMHKVPGITYLETPLSTLQRAAWQERTVSDFARFFAASWVRRLGRRDYSSEYSLRDLKNKLDILLQHLPPRFAALIFQLRGELPAIFALEYPLVLTHTDLCPMNIIVDPEAGGINGIVGWADARILPFGMSLWGLYNMLGIMDPTGWHYHENHGRLESVFWDTFYGLVETVSDDQKRAMKVAEKVGLVLRYGFTLDDELLERPATEEDSSMRYLDAFAHRLEG